jgi:hypothetical protein
MSLSDDLNQAAQYTGSIFQRIGDLLILIVLSIIPIVDFIALGYYARIVRDSPSSKSAPKLERYGDMFVEGLKIFIVGIIWLIIIGIIAAIIAIPFVAAAVFSSISNPMSFFSSGWIFALGALAIIFAIVAFLLGIFAFMGVIHMVKTNSFGKAFAFVEIYKMIGKIGWIRYLASFVVFFIVLAIVGALNGSLGPIGWVVGAVLSVLAGLFISRTIGLMYDNAAGVTAQPSAVQQAPVQ